MQSLRELDTSLNVLGLRLRSWDCDDRMMTTVVIFGEETLKSPSSDEEVKEDPLDGTPQKPRSCPTFPCFASGPPLSVLPNAVNPRWIGIHGIQADMLLPFRHQVRNITGPVWVENPSCWSFVLLQILKIWHFLGQFDHCDWIMKARACSSAGYTEESKVKARACSSAGYTEESKVRGH